MTCIRCGSSEIHRSRRSGACDRISSWIGRYPYRCQHCGMRFRAAGRYVNPNSRNPKSTHSERAKDQYGAPRATSGQCGPDMVFRAHAAKPQAKIVVQAETHEQLNQILLTLDKAINSYGRSARPEKTQASYAAR